MKSACDSVALCIFAIVVACVVGCVENEVRENLQPFIAVSGNYGVWESAATPAPAPGPKACGNCRGTGKVLERPDKPDSRVYMKCPACDGTGVEKAKGVPCTSGTCPPVMRSIAR